MEGLVFALKKAGFYLSKDNERIKEFKNSRGRIAYMTTAQDIPGVVFHAMYEAKVRALATKSGHEADDGYYHNSNMRAYTTRRHGGDDDIHYGVKVQFRSVSQMTAVLEVLA